MVSFSERLEQQDLLLLKQAVNKKYTKKKKKKRYNITIYEEYSFAHLVNHLVLTIKRRPYSSKSENAKLILLEHQFQKKKSNIFYCAWLSHLITLFY